MNVVNAIGKVRFNSARPQRVQLSRCPHFTCDLLCLEPKQELCAAGRCAYYVIAGSGDVWSGKLSTHVTMGHFAACEPGECHTLINSSEQRLICLAVTYSSD